MLTPDFEQMWQRLAPDFMADAIREFNGYPEVVLAWSAYLGAAVAWCWDKDWAAYKDMDYAFFCGEFQHFGRYHFHTLQSSMYLDCSIQPLACSGSLS